VRGHLGSIEAGRVQTAERGPGPRLREWRNEDVFRFGQFELVPARRLLAKEGRAVKIGSRAFDVLTVLVGNAGSVVESQELMVRVWGKVVVEDSNLRVHISTLRRLLEDDGRENRYIVHVARRGYVFVAGPLPASESMGGGARFGDSNLPCERSVGARVSRTNSAVAMHLPFAPAKQSSAQPSSS